MEKVDMKKLFEAFQQFIKELKGIKDELKEEISQLNENVLAKIKHLQYQLDGMQDLNDEFAKFKHEIKTDVDALKNDLENKFQQLRKEVADENSNKKSTIKNIEENFKKDYVVESASKKDQEPKKDPIAGPAGLEDNTKKTEESLPPQ